MKYLDYREALGIGFNDDKIAKMLKAKIVTFLNQFSNYNNPYNEFDTDKFCIYYMAIGEELNGSYYTWNNLALSITQEGTIPSMVCRYVVFMNNAKHIFNNNYYPYTDILKAIPEFLFDSLSELNINYAKKIDDDGIFVFPKGAKELDDALVSEPLTWLEEYPKTRETFVRALKQYSNGEYVRDVADNFRKALEEFFQEFLGNSKNLENNINEVFKYLGNNNAEPEIASMMNSLLKSYKNLNNSAAKHNDKLDPKYLEFLMYQTGLFIRMIITAGKE